MKFKVEFSVDNAAFEEDMSEETARILEKIAESVRRGLCPSIMDSNGNRIGEFGFEE